MERLPRHHSPLALRSDSKAEDPRAAIDRIFLTTRSGWTTHRVMIRIVVSAAYSALWLSSFMAQEGCA